MIVLLVQALEDVENKGTVLHVLAEVAEVVSHPLHLAVVVVDAQIILHEEPKLCIEVEGARLSCCLGTAPRVQPKAAKRCGRRRELSPRGRR
jgi:hypothetical protein